MPVQKIILAFISISSLCMAVGCSSTSVDLDSSRHAAAIEQDRQNLQSPAQIPKRMNLSLEQAMDMALQENLDARVSALEYLSAQDNVTLENIKALPNVKWDLERNGRNSDPASTSFSVATGLQSLEPSISTERYRNTRDLTVSWNIIDAATALMQARSASDRAAISAERFAKVQQNIYRDVRSAYWRAWADDHTASETRNLIAQARAHMDKIDSAAAQRLISKSEAAQRKTPFLQAAKSLETLQNQIGLANIELKSLLNVPQDTVLILTSPPPKSTKALDEILKEDLEGLELLALQNRPEMREAFLEKNISIRAAKEEIVRTIPGTELFYALNGDSNRYLENNSWRSYSASLIQNITNLLTLPARYSIARKNEDLSEARRVTLAAAIIAQLHIARQGLGYAMDLQEIAQQEKQAAKSQSFAAQKRQHTGHAAKGDVLLARMQTQEKQIESYQALAASQDSYAALLNTLGLGLEDDPSLASLRAKTLEAASDRAEKGAAT